MIATVRILEPFVVVVCFFFVFVFFGGGVGGPKSILFSLFWNNKASSKYIYTLNGVHL